MIFIVFLLIGYWGFAGESLQPEADHSIVNIQGDEQVWQDRSKVMRACIALPVGGKELRALCLEVGRKSANYCGTSDLPDEMKALLRDHDNRVHIGGGASPNSINHIVNHKKPLQEIIRPPSKA